MAFLLFLLQTPRWLYLFFSDPTSNAFTIQTSVKRHLVLKGTNHDNPVPFDKSVFPIF